MHLPESEILVDLSNAIVLSNVNNDFELSVTASFPEPLPIGEYPATKAVFGPVSGFFHITQGMASGTFADGQSLEVHVDASVIPEPSTLALGSIACCFSWASPDVAAGDRRTEYWVLSTVYTRWSLFIEILNRR